MTEPDCSIGTTCWCSSAARCWELCAGWSCQERVVKPGFLSLSANVQTAIAAIDTMLAELVTAEGVAS